MRKFSMFVAGVLFASLAFAQAPNDVGVPAVGTLNLGPGTPHTGSNGAPSCPPAGVLEGTFTGTTTQSGRIFRDAIPSTCPSKVYPGIFNVGTTYNYESYTYSNTDAAAACVTVNFDPDTVGASPCTTNAHASAYIGSYDPLNQATNFVGDVGSSLAQPFSFEVPAGQDMVLVVTNTSAQGVCTYGFEIVALPCSAGPGPTLPPDWIDVPTADHRGLMALAGLLALVGVVVIVRMRH